MRTLSLMVLLVIVATFALACGEAATSAPPTATTAPIAAPTEAPTIAPTEAPATEAPAQMEGDYSPELLAIAAERANKCGRHSMWET